jgi:hypothetical protein
MWVRTAGSCSAHGRALRRRCRRLQRAVGLNRR